MRQGSPLTTLTRSPSPDCPGASKGSCVHIVLAQTARPTTHFRAILRDGQPTLRQTATGLGGQPYDSKGVRVGAHGVGRFARGAAALNASSSRGLRGRGVMCGKCSEFSGREHNATGCLGAVASRAASAGPAVRLANSGL
jgi:hypothetical protein